MSATTADAVVIGAGIVGAACARALAREGRKVLVLEAAVAGSGATAAGMGHVSLMDDNDPEFVITRYSRDLWIDLVPELPPAAEYHPCGAIWVAEDEEELDAARRKRAYCEARGVATEVLDAAQLAEAEPNLRPGLAGGLLVPDDLVVYPPAVAQWMLDRARAEVWTNARVSEVAGAEVHLADGRHVSAGVVVCASGITAGMLVPSIRIRPRKGHLAITDRYPGFVNHQLVELGYLKSAHGGATESVAFNLQPRPTGQLLLGSSRQFDLADQVVDWEILRRMMQRGFDLMPGLRDLSVIRVWTGVRAATEDNQPFIGPAPGIPKLYLAAGHEGLGATTALAVAELIAASVAGRTPPIPIEPYLPERAMGRTNV
jgi:D-hydroxyproline dehydrogenase subunit beta